MSNTPCTNCNKAKANLVCGLCEAVICKKCTLFIEEDTFSFLPKIPAELQHTAYCGTCYDTKVAPALEKYNALMEQAKNTMVFTKAQSKATRLIKRLENVVEVIDCADHDEVILRLAFFAAQLKYNSILDVDVTSRKIIDGAYQTTVWSGTGMPADVLESRLIKDRANWSSPN